MLNEHGDRFRAQAKNLRKHVTDIEAEQQDNRLAGLAEEINLNKLVARPTLKRIARGARNGLSEDERKGWLLR